jgi:hypothetical protein
MENVLYFFNKESYLHEEVNCTEPSPLVSVPSARLNVSLGKGLPPLVSCYTTEDLFKETEMIHQRPEVLFLTF